MGLAITKARERRLSALTLEVSVERGYGTARAMSGSGHWDLSLNTKTRRPTACIQSEVAGMTVMNKKWNALRDAKDFQCWLDVILDSE